MPRPRFPCAPAARCWALGAQMQRQGPGQGQARFRGWRTGSPAGYPRPSRDQE